MKIVFIIDSLQRYGTQRFLVQLARGLHDLNYKQNVIALNKASAPDVEQALSGAGCAITQIGKGALLLGGLGWWRMVAILKRTKPDVVMTMLDFADTLGRPAARLAGCRVLLSSIRARNLAKPGWQRWIDRKTVAWAEKVIFNSESVVSYARQKESVSQEQVIVIPNGVADLLALNGSLRASYRQKLGLSPETVLLGSVNRLHPQKNLPLLLRAAAMLTTSHPWKIVVIGDGAERSRLRSVARDVGVADRVIWLGARDDVEGWLSAIDLFVHTANFEGMPNAVMEAMAMGLPVVASAVDGVSELIRDNVSGYLVPPGAADLFARRITAIIEDRQSAVRLGAEAHRDVLERFSTARMIAGYHQLFLSLTKPH